MPYPCNNLLTDYIQKRRGEPGLFSFEYNLLPKTRGFSKDTVLCGGYWLWAWQISGGLQTCIAKRSKVPNG